ncbi:hypothetical protein QFZ76_003295 [Streptomyces sp. V4I2]|nr:hypothetical protein [Streptomyces sp. V4I2]
MRKSWMRIIREALQSGDGTLRLVFLMGAGVACGATFVGVLAVARLVGLL